jgi:hypothetical protein
MRRLEWPDVPKHWPTLYGVAERGKFFASSGWYDDDGTLWWVTIDPRTGTAWTWCAS